MPTCPHCEEPVETLEVIFNIRGWETATVHISSIDDVTEWGDTETTDRETDYYRCTHCNEDISASEAEALQRQYENENPVRAPQVRRQRTAGRDAVFTATATEYVHSCKHCKHSFIRDEDETHCPRCKKQL